MGNTQLKHAAVAALRTSPDFAGLHQLQRCTEQQKDKFLRWLDESGLALYFLARLESLRHLDSIPAEMLRELTRRRVANRERVLAMLSEFVRVNAALQERCVPYVVLKGFSLVPEFSPDAELRHQTDIDLLVDPKHLREAQDAVAACGYFVEEVHPSGEIRMSNSLQYVPTKHDDIYAPSPHRRVELHASVFDSDQAVDLNLPADFLNRSEWTEIGGHPAPVLCLADRFLVQCLHSFRHILASWGRLAWLYEISNFIEHHQAESALWQQVSSRLVNDDLAASCSLVLRLTGRMFGVEPPPELMHSNGSCSNVNRDALIQAWVAEFGEEWALSGMEGSKVSLFVHREFVKDGRAWRQYLLRRLLPFEQRPLLTRVPHGKSGLRSVVHQGFRYVERASYHAWALVDFGLESLRWRRALRSAMKAANRRVGETTQEHFAGG